MRHSILFTALLLAFVSPTSPIDTIPSAEAGYRPAGVGSNLHRRFVIKRTQQRASQGKSVRRHYGVWVAGGFRETVRSAQRR